jgi:hypothetical protein
LVFTKLLQVYLASDQFELSEVQHDESLFIISQQPV